MCGVSWAVVTSAALLPLCESDLSCNTIQTITKTSQLHFLFLTQSISVFSYTAAPPPRAHINSTIMVYTSTAV